MATHLVLETFEGVYDNQSWRIRAGEIVDDTRVPVAALKPYGLSYVTYAAGLQTAINAYNEQHGRDDVPPSMWPMLEAYDVIPTATALQGRTTVTEADISAIEATEISNEGVAACVIAIQAGQPTTLDTFTVGADIYEVDGAGVNINFALAGSAELTLDALLAAAVASGTENLYWDKLTATTLRIRTADAPQGNIVGADPSIVLDSSSMANWSFDTGDINMNTLAGVALAAVQSATAQITITTAMITATLHHLSFTFTPTKFVYSAVTSAGVPVAWTADALVITGDDIVLTLGTDLANTDVLTVTASE